MRFPEEKNRTNRLPHNVLKHKTQTINLLQQQHMTRIVSNLSPRHCEQRVFHLQQANA
jgi:hypothetical protein